MSSSGGRRRAGDFEHETCPKCGQPSVSPPAEVYCAECATEGWERDAAAWRAFRAGEQRGGLRVLDGGVS